jgi:hypothetical protein
VQGAAEIIDIAFKRHADDLRGMWQGRVLARCLVLVNGVARPKTMMDAVVLSVLAHNFDEAMPVLLRVCHPGYQGLGTPMLCSAARIARTGHVMADFITKDGMKVKNQALFRNQRKMEKAFRDLADEVRLSDDDRRDLFAAVQRWVVCDYRIDPTMNPADPDAKRLVVH